MENRHKMPLPKTEKLDLRTESVKTLAREISEKKIEVKEKLDLLSVIRREIMAMNSNEFIYNEKWNQFNSEVSHIDHFLDEVLHLSMEGSHAKYAEEASEESLSNLGKINGKMDDLLAEIKLIFDSRFFGSLPDSAQGTLHKYRLKIHGHAHFHHPINTIENFIELLKRRNYPESSVKNFVV